MSQTIRRGGTGSPTKTLNSSAILEHAVGECRPVEVKLQGVSVTCLLDSGSQVSMISESFFQKAFVR